MNQDGPSTRELARPLSFGIEPARQKEGQCQIPTPLQPHWDPYRVGKELASPIPCQRQGSDYQSLNNKRVDQVHGTTLNLDIWR